MVIERKTHSWRATPATYGIITINMAVFIALNTIPNLADKLLLYPALETLWLRPWTLLTVFFSHEILIHLLANMSLVFFFGGRLERATNSRSVLLVYFLAGLTGSLTIPPLVLLIGGSDLIPGASAAAFGVVAAYAAIHPDVVMLRSKAYQWVLGLFVFNGIWFIVMPARAHGGAAHAVGILVGYLLGCWLKRRQASLSAKTMDKLA